MYRLLHSCIFWGMQHHFFRHGIIYDNVSSRAQHQLQTSGARAAGWNQLHGRVVPGTIKVEVEAVGLG